MKNCTGLNLGDGLWIFNSFHFPDSGLYLLNGFDLILVHFEWRDNENQPFGTDFLHVNGAQNINQGGE